jgi:hypothetical protein
MTVGLAMSCAIGAALWIEAGCAGPTEADPSASAHTAYLSGGSDPLPPSELPAAFATAAPTLDDSVQAEVLAALSSDGGVERIREAFAAVERARQARLREGTPLDERELVAVRDVIVRSITEADRRAMNEALAEGARSLSPTEADLRIEAELRRELARREAGGER